MYICTPQSSEGTGFLRELTTKVERPPYAATGDRRALAKRMGARLPCTTYHGPLQRKLGGVAGRQISQKTSPDTAPTSAKGI
jgi:hypothetical protein